MILKRTPVPELDDPERQPRFDTSTVRNTEPAVSLLEYRLLEICNRFYRVPPISGRDGVRLLALQVRLEKLGDKDTTALSGVLDELRSIAKRLLIPLGWRRHLPLFLRRDPLRDATEREMGAVLGSFLAYRMNGPLRVRAAPDAPSR